MSRCGWAIVGVLVVAAVVLAVVLWPSSHPELDPDRADRVTLYSIDFRFLERQRLPDAGDEVVYGCPVLGKVEVTDIEQRRQLLDALKSAISEWGVDYYACFWPRHVLRVESDGRTTDYVICFQCHNYRKCVEGRSVADSTIGEGAAPLFNKLLEDAGIPIVPKQP
jgi:hypothetical protein